MGTHTAFGKLNQLVVRRREEGDDLTQMGVGRLESHGFGHNNDRQWAMSNIIFLQ
jgi:hypothetical protein